MKAADPIRQPSVAVNGNPLRPLRDGQVSIPILIALQ